MLTQDEVEWELKRQLAIDFNCHEDDLNQNENIVTTVQAKNGRRVYTKQPAFFSMVTLGHGAVICAEESMHPWLHQYIKNKQGIWLFEHQNLREFDRKLIEYGKQLWQTHHMFLPKMEIQSVDVEFEVRWFQTEEIQSMYGNPDYSNALCECFLPERPDVLAVAAIIDNQIAGLAGCSKDSERMWQIGIDVLPAYRGRRIGQKLVGLLKNEIIRRGAIPFYGTSLSNLPSWKIALLSGFYPAWIEVETL